MFTAALCCRHKNISSQRTYASLVKAKSFDEQSLEAAIFETLPLLALYSSRHFQPARCQDITANDETV